MKNAIPCKTLRSITFTGYSRYFDALDRFFVAFGSTIESLTLNLKIISCRLDGIDLERDLLNRMPRLSSLDLLIYCNMKRDGGDEFNKVDIKTFQTTAWLKFNPVVCRERFSNDRNMIFTLPCKLDHVRDRFDASIRNIFSLIFWFFSVHY